MTVDDQTEQPGNCAACGQPLPGRQEPATATPAPLFTVPLSAKQLNGKRIHHVDSTTDTGTFAVAVSPVYQVVVDACLVDQRKYFGIDYISHDELVELCRVTTDRPDPVAPVSLAKKRGQRTVNPRKALAPNDDHPTQENTAS